MDLTQTIIAKSDQLNADDMVGGPMTFTVADVRQGDSEQPVSIVLAEWPASRPFKPSKTVLRILVLAWGAESNEWPKNARMTLYRDPDVKWAGQKVGGIRVSHLSHIKEPLSVALAESKGKKILYTVKPLPDVPAEPSKAEQAAQIITALDAATTEAEVREWGNHAISRGVVKEVVDGKTVRDHVIARLAEFDYVEPTDEIVGQTSIGDDAA